MAVRICLTVEPSTWSGLKSVISVWPCSVFWKQDTFVLDRQYQQLTYSIKLYTLTGGGEHPGGISSVLFHLIYCHAREKSSSDKICVISNPYIKAARIRFSKINKQATKAYPKTFVTITHCVQNRYLLTPLQTTKDPCEYSVQSDADRLVSLGNSLFLSNLNVFHWNST